MQKNNSFRFSNSLVSIVLIFVLLSGCANLPDNSQRKKITALPAGTTLFVSDYMQNDKTAGLTDSGFRLLGNGLDAFAARAVLITNAQRSIDAQYYLVHDDLVGNTFLGLLLQAAERGVRVRLLIDDIDISKQDKLLAALDAHPNFEVRSFNPFSRNTFRLTQYLTRFGSVTRRMHNKTFTVDNNVSILGGRNIGNEYFSADTNIAFGDLDVLTIGPVVNDVSISFDDYWNDDLAYSMTSIVRKKFSFDQITKTQTQALAFLKTNDESKYAKALRESDFAKALINKKLKLYWGKATLVSDSAKKLSSSRDQTDLFLEKYLETEFANAKSQATIISPYFIPGKNGLEGFAALEQQGVNIRVLTNSLKSNNHSVVLAHYIKYREDLLDAGVELYEARDSSTDNEQDSVLHTKSFIIDRKRVFIGSLNFDKRSVIENTEIGIVFESEQMAEDIEAWLDSNLSLISYKLGFNPETPDEKNIVWELNNGTQTKYLTTEPDTSLLDRIKMRSMSLLPIESQL